MVEKGIRDVTNKSWINWDDYSDDCEYVDVPTGMAWKGRAAIQEMIDATNSSMGDTTFSEGLFSYESDQVSVGWSRWYGVMDEDMGGVAAKGKPFDVQGVTIKVKDENGKVVKHIDCWDALSQMAQLGAVPSFTELMMGKTMGDSSA